MPSVYDFKPRFQGLLHPLVSRLATAGVTPNQVTLAGIGLSLAAGVAIFCQPYARWPLLLLPLVLLLRMALNAVDGMLAREHGRVTALGGILNELGDVISDAVLYLPLARIPGLLPELVVLVVMGAAMSEMAGVTGIQVGASRRFDGPLGKSDRALWFGTLGLILGLGVEAGSWTDGVLALMVFLSALTVVNRVRRALGELA